MTAISHPQHDAPISGAPLNFSRRTAKAGIAIILMVTALLGAASLAFGTNSDAIDATELNAR
ncbi:unannotated protein [freshwater metagenome]|uniref:Unannotated protein n=1 Tax=freshwater metagenome TaxID=449393 RepID=A0A6J6H3M9_9ZZZZ|nr:hypothetical protein [Actinomycetota bacterium]MSZ95810.1 hypothetical protein [Actinomycetota bacterium]